MGDQQKMRASDRDRQQVVGQLRSALEDGRLAMPTARHAPAAVNG
jgi:hypothetical protein